MSTKKTSAKASRLDHPNPTTGGMPLPTVVSPNSIPSNSRNTKGASAQTNGNATTATDHSRETQENGTESRVDPNAELGVAEDVVPTSLPPLTTAGRGGNNSSTLTIIQPPEEVNVPFTKPTTRFGWHMGPEQVPFVFGPFITKTEGLLMALLSQMSELDVALYVAMMRMVALSPAQVALTGSSAADEEEEEEEEDTFVQNQVKLGLAKFQQAQGGTKAELVYEDLLLVNRFFTGKWKAPADGLFSLATILCGFAVQPEGSQNTPCLYPEGALLPIEYLVAMTRLVQSVRVHTTGDEQDSVFAQLPFLQLARRCLLLNLRKEKPSLTDRDTPPGGFDVETAAQLHLLSTLCSERETVKELVDEEGTNKIVALLEHPNAAVVDAALGVLGTFAEGEEVVATLLKCNVIRSLKVLMDQLSKRYVAKAAALYTLGRIAMEHGAEVVAAGMDEVGIRLMSPEQSLHIRKQAVALVHVLAAYKHLNHVLLHQVTQKISSLMQLEFEMTPVVSIHQRHRLYRLLENVARDLTDIEAQHSALFADCVKVLKDPKSIAAYKRYEAEGSECTLCTQCFAWRLSLQRFYRDHVEA